MLFIDSDDNRRKGLNDHKCFQETFTNEKIRKIVRLLIIPINNYK